MQMCMNDLQRMKNIFLEDRKKEKIRKNIFNLKEISQFISKRLQFRI